MKSPTRAKTFSFQARLDRIATGVEYYGLAVPATITKALGTTAAVPISAQVNGSTPFLISLYPKGGGQHGLRVKATVRAQVGIKEGDRVRVQFTVRDHAAEVSPPPDLVRALSAAGRLDSFHAQPPGKRSFTLRWIDQAAKPETRAKRIRETVEDARPK